MNINQFVDRLWSLARRAPALAEGAAPFGLETAVLAHWREARAQRLSDSVILRGLRWAALLACAVAVLAGALDRDELTAFGSGYDPERNLADSAISAAFGNE
jgi:hypothetical protein